MWWFLAPGGLPVTHPQFLAGAVLPAIVVLLGLAALHPRSAHAALASWTALWCMGLVTALVLYSDGRVRIALACAVPCGVLLATCLAVSIADRSRWNRSAAGLALSGAAVGIAFPFAVRAPAPSTKPLGGDPPRLAGEPLGPDVLKPADDVEMNRRTAVCRVARDSIDIEVQPLLRFRSRSPDRGWTLFARSPERNADRTLTVTRAVPIDDGIRLFAQGVATHLLDARAVAPGTLRLDAWSQLDAPEFAHLSSCADISVWGVWGDVDPEIEVSAVPGELFAANPGHLGRRFAALLPDGSLRVLEGALWEKGPYTTLGEGALRPDEPLTLTVHHGGRPRARIVLHDFASQASTELSPTAGDGVPQNSISFIQQVGESRIRILATWAGTGIGRGWDTVGHAAGTYRNRIDVEILR